VNIVPVITIQQIFFWGFFLFYGTFAVCSKWRGSKSSVQNPALPYCTLPAHTANVPENKNKTILVQLYSYDRDNIYEKCRHAKKAAQKWLSAFFCVRFPLFAHWERKKSGHLPKAEVCFWIRFLPLFCRNISYIISVRPSPMHHESRYTTRKNGKFCRVFMSWPGLDTVEWLFYRDRAWSRYDA
jgi:hypothetical protein